MAERPCHSPVVATPRRTLVERIRDPDAELPHFLFMLRLVIPFSVLFLPLGLLAIHILLRAALGAESAAATAILGVTAFVLKVTLPVALISFGGFWLLRFYVVAKLRRRALGPTP